MSGGWFESVAIAQRRAQRRLPRSVYGAIVAGSERGLTLADNVAAFDELGFVPRIAAAAAPRTMDITVLGQELSLPVLLSPTGVQAVHPDGELAVARAAASRGTALGLSAFASKPIEEVVAANPRTFFQSYWAGSRDRMVARLERAMAAGAAGLIVTLDWSFSHARDWGSPAIPERLDLRAMLRHAPEALSAPQWLAEWVRRRALPDLAVPNMAVGGERPPTFFEAYGEWMQTPPPSWEDLRWLRAQWRGPVMIKGVMHPDDGRRAVEIGADAISVSNHGGNNLDGTPATIRALPAVARAVGDQVQVLLDGGIRRGSDAVKALALGAHAVMLGRAYLWGLAVNGQAGVENVLDIMRGGIDSALLGLGRGSADELSAADLLVGEGFEHGSLRAGGRPVAMR
ncbi:MAG: pre-mycofactocin synthase MftD [Solirubrobacteraceae bacterium]